VTKRSTYLTPVVKLALEKKLLTQEQFEACKQTCQKAKRLGIEATIDEMLVKQGHLTDQQLAELTDISSMTDGDSSFGNYRLGNLLGEGGMGKVYEAWDEYTRRKVALKVVSTSYMREEDNQKRFYQEIRALAKLHHPNITTLFDAGKVKRRYYFTMEYVEGVTLHEFVQKNGPLTLHTALQILHQIAGALSYAHKRDVIHRDVKPENILLTEDGTPKLTDFGVVMHTDDDRMTLTSAGMMVGSPHFSSPEQIDGTRTIDGRSDLYSLGLCMWYAVTGKTMHRGDNIQEVVAQHLAGIWLDPRPYNSTLNRGFSQILKKLCASQRERRYQSAMEVRVAAKNLLHRPVRNLILRLISFIAVFLLGGFYQSLGGWEAIIALFSNTSS